MKIPGDGTLVYSVSGGSTWRWSRTVEIGLAPLELVREDTAGFWAMGENEEAQSWSWRTFAGLTVAVAPKCDPKSGAPLSDTTERAFVPVPAVAIDPTFVAEWQNIALGDCAAHAGIDERGFVLAGSAARDDAEIAVVTMGDRVYIEVADDVFTRKDTLEVWVTTQDTSYMSPCFGSGPAPVGASSSVMAQSGAGARPGAAKLQVMRLTSDRRRLRTVWALPAVNARFTVVYRDSDDDKRFERVIATSDFDPKDPSTVGGTRSIPNDRFACEVEGGVLRQVARESRRANEPFID